ncbi:hypothetical protein Skr01_40490 [Sphaerisporangium krabiense]|uniref:NADPH-dependent ferric siderophore reductase/SAM-dependent methyltransferase n=1 Tax=Sphaerisporangium krabiense TaxID=763782 RepID=A0A7W8ZA39_9ACTN|nr:SIP domain-containing protein [Sphaerisporangium krabiense]MBB5629863.1 NADPH-dependent ferric siderophore reductase/SAM-dependent methyltransferase [Sphaerisporangium krabiense]GII63964.1 hypothetical protein Skr01_40490 [Sphaerisporangium krabiense]
MTDLLHAPPPGAYAEAEIDTALEALAQAGAQRYSGGTFADVGCGSGEVAAAMAEDEFTVTARDASPAWVAATRARCAGLAVTAEVRDPGAPLAEGGYDIVHSSWALHTVADAGAAVRAMARAVRPGGLLVLQWGFAQPRAEGFPLRDVVRSLAADPVWRDRLAAVPFAPHAHPLEEVRAVLAAEGLEVLLAEGVRVTDGPGQEEACRAAVAAQVRALGGDGPRFADAVVGALAAAGALDARTVRLTARRPRAEEAAAGGASRPRSPVRAFPLATGMLEVASVTRLSPLMRRMVLRVDGDPLPVEEPGEIITLVWPAPGAEVVLPERGRWRFPPGTGPQHAVNYTVRRHDPRAGLVTIDFFDHGEEALASRWARHAAPGDRVGYAGTRVHWAADPFASWTLLAGDETALPSIAAVAETLPAGGRHIAVVEVRDAAERAALDAAHPEVHWVYRGERAPGVGRAVEDVVRGLELPPGRGQVWAGGESLMIQSLRRHLTRERGVPRDQVCALGYWSIPRDQRGAGS